MRITHLCTYERGGAAAAALRQHRALLAAGYDSRFLIARQRGLALQDSRIAVLPSVPVPSTAQRLLNRLGLPQTPEQAHYRHLAKVRLKASFEIFSSPLSSQRFEAHPWVQEADVLNLHWVADALDYPSFFRGIGSKPLVWTFHDMNPFMGGFHYRGDQVRNAFHLGGLEAEYAQHKRQALQQLKPGQLQVVCPSTWLLEEAKASGWFEGAGFKHIPHCLDTQVFRPQDRLAARAALGLPADKFILLFVSENLSNRRKGMAELLAALQAWQPDAGQYLLLAIGETAKLPESPLPIQALGRIEEEAQMALAYAAADLFVLPSAEDNLPNVVLEALCCGTPVAGFAVGGMLDMVEPGINGALAPVGNAQALAKVLAELSQKRFDPQTLAQAAAQRYAPEVCADRYTALYRQVLGSGNA